MAAQASKSCSTKDSLSSLVRSLVKSSAPWPELTSMAANTSLDGSPLKGERFTCEPRTKRMAMKLLIGILPCASNPSTTCLAACHSCSTLPKSGSTLKMHDTSVDAAMVSMCFWKWIEAGKVMLYVSEIFSDADAGTDDVVTCLDVPRRK